MITNIKSYKNWTFKKIALQIKYKMFVRLKYLTNIHINIYIYRNMLNFTGQKLKKILAKNQI